MRKILMLAGAVALLLVSWIMPVQTSEAVPYYCGCDWCDNPSYSDTTCQDPLTETPTTCGEFYNSVCS